MPGQIYPRKTNAEQTKAMLQYAARPPAENFRRLMDDGLRLLGLNSNNPVLVSMNLILKTLCLLFT